MYTIGQIVISKCGRDKGHVFIIFSVLEEYVYLIDGCTHKIAKPKKKKMKHVQVTKNVSTKIREMILSDTRILDADVRKELLPFRISV